jgi:hypothetical protein
MMTASRLSAFTLLGGLLLLTACAPRLSPAERAALDRAAVEMDRQLTPAGQIAATAALIYEDEGRFPATQFELLGSRQAADTGARFRNFSALQVDATPERLTLRYTLLPTREDPTDRMGTIHLRPAEGDGQYQAEVELLRRVDPDHGGAFVPLATDGRIEVRRLSGHFHVDIDTVRRQAAANQAGDLPLQDKPYRITFTPSPPTATGFPPELERGYPVVIGD